MHSYKIFAVKKINESIFRDLFNYRVNLGSPIRLLYYSDGFYEKVIFLGREIWDSTKDKTEFNSVFAFELFIKQKLNKPLLQMIAKQLQIEKQKDKD